MESNEEMRIEVGMVMMACLICGVAAGLRTPDYNLVDVIESRLQYLYPSRIDKSLLDAVADAMSVWAVYKKHLGHFDFPIGGQLQ